MMFAEVAPAIPLSSVISRGVYTYRVPKNQESKAAVGSKVKISIGPREVLGTIVRLHHEKVPYPTKTLAIVDQSPLTLAQLDFAHWLATTMHSGLGYTLRLFFPPITTALAGKRPQKKPPLAPSVTREPIAPALLIEKNGRLRARDIGNALSSVIKNRAQALILVPEVHLIKPLQQAMSRQGLPVETYHSDRTPRELAEVWQALYQGKSIVVIGTQKALFLPWRKLSHLVVEEEYLETHKLWDQYPRLDNRYGAEHLAAIHGSELIFSSPILSPLLKAQFADKKKNIIKNNPLVPKTKIIPISYLERNQGHLLPAEVVHSLKEGLKKKEKIVVLHNQRGSWRSAVCQACHQALRCPECHSTVFVTGSGKKLRLQCRQCSFQGSLPTECPNCHSKKIRIFGPGTARISSIIRELMPKAHILEITAARSPSLADAAAADIILGTTALFQYLPPQSVDHAFWLFPETTLLYPDYRSHERAWNLLVRLQSLLPARRQVILVTRHLDLIKHSLAASADKIMDALLRERATLHYPPYTDLIKLTIHAKKEIAAFEKGRTIRQAIDEKKPSTVFIRGPYQGFNKKDAGKFAVHLLLAGPLAELVPLYKDLPVDRADLSPAQIL